MLRFREKCLAAPQSSLGSLLVGQIEHEIHTLVVPPVFKKCAAEKHSHSAAVFAIIFFLVGVKAARRLQFGYCSFVMVTPFGWCQVSPTHATRGEIFAVVLHHVEKGIIGRSDRTV